MIIQLLLQIYIGYELAVIPSGDRNTIFKPASEMALQNIFQVNDKYNSYFLRYPNNQFFLLIETGWFLLLKKMGFTNFIYGNIALNILVVDFAIILCAILVNRKYGKKATIFFQIMAFLFAPFYTYIPFLYTDTLVLPIIAGLLLCYQFIEENFDGKSRKFYLPICVMGILTWIGFNLKATAAIITIACSIHMIITKKWKRGILATMVFILIFSVCNITFETIMNKTAVIDQTDYDKENYPYTHWIMMGLKDRGDYNPADNKYTSSFETKQDKKAGNIKMIQKRLKNYGIPGLLLHQYKKAIYTWSNGKYGMELKLQIQAIRKSWMQSIFFTNGTFYPLYNGYCTLS